jgi:hypothetical protein
MPPGPPRPLADDAGRERLLRLLREHYARGELELDDLSRRVGLVLAARYADEVAAALAGLPQLPPDGGAPGAGNSTAPGAGGPRPARRWRRGHAGLGRPRRPEPSLRARTRGVVIDRGPRSRVAITRAPFVATP